MPLPIEDLNSGLKLYKTGLVKLYLPLCPNGMSFSDILTLLFINQRNKVIELPIQIRSRQDGKSTISVLTAFETLMSILNISMMFNPCASFCPSVFYRFWLAWPGTADHICRPGCQRWLLAHADYSGNFLFPLALSLRRSQLYASSFWTCSVSVGTSQMTAKPSQQRQAIVQTKARRQYQLEPWQLYSAFWHYGGSFGITFLQLQILPTCSTTSKLASSASRIHLFLIAISTFICKNFSSKPRPRPCWVFRTFGLF